MPPPETETSVARSLSKAERKGVPSATKTAVMQCLVTSCDQQRREMLCEAAVKHGWQAIPCKDGKRAARHSVLDRVHLALIDLQSALSIQQAEMKRLVESLARGGDTLLVLCGSEEDPEEEVWARQLGVWMYLPGVDEQSDIGSLCEEARQVAAQRLPEE